MKRRWIVLMILLAVMTSSCRLVFKTPEVERVRDVSIKNFSVDQTELELSLLVYNPNSYNIKLKKLDVDILNMDRQKIGHGQLSREYTLGKKQTARIDFGVNLQTRPTLGLINYSNYNVDMFIVARGEGKANGFTKKFNYDEPYSISLKEQITGEIPRFKVDTQDLFKVMRTYVHQYKLNATALRTDFMLLNPYGLRYKVLAFPADIYIDDKKVGHGDLLKQLSFKEDVFYREGVMEFEMSNLKSILSAARGVVKGGMNYSVRGEIVLEILGARISAPYAYKGFIPMNVWELILSYGTKSS
ncbi:MAG: hypothetical protein LHW60_05885 [Candidatus Cloacimonetes bacterium]|nr:hypothetical protein [Candidatus Cloacimonadota bacterium]